MEAVDDVQEYKCRESMDSVSGKRREQVFETRMPEGINIK